MQPNSISIKGMAPYLQVYDMPTSLQFYRDKLGFQLINQSQPDRGDDCGWALLSKDGIQLMLNTIYEKPYRPEKPDTNRAIGHSDVVLYFSCADIEGMYKFLLSKGLNIKEPFVTGYQFKAIFFADPDNYGICFHWPLNE